LEELLPKALNVLREHLGEGDQPNPNAWRAAVRLFEYAVGSPTDQQPEPVPDELPFEELTAEQRAQLRREILGSGRTCGRVTDPDLAAPPPPQKETAVRDPSYRRASLASPSSTSTRTDECRVKRGRVHPILDFARLLR
jgi:hypothetical protein